MRSTDLNFVEVPVWHDYKWGDLLVNGVLYTPYGSFIVTTGTIYIHFFISLQAAPVAKKMPPEADVETRRLKNVRA